MTDRRAVSETVDDWDVFISYASEDKDDFVLPLAEKLDSLGLRVWFDDFELMIGDSLIESIDHGLAHSGLGVVVLSPSFFRKQWPRRELRGLVTREMRDEATALLPIWHNVTKDDVSRFSLPLADRVSGRSQEGVETLAFRIAQRFATTNPGAELRFELIELRVTDSFRTIVRTRPYRFTARDRIYAEVELRNAGLRTWLPSAPTRSEWNNLLCGPVRLATSSPKDHVSLIVDEASWIAVNRPTSVYPSQVAHGEVGKFTFEAVAPETPGHYVEHFSLVCDGYAWFRGPEIDFELHVANEGDVGGGATAQ